MEAHWRDSMRIARFFTFDARAGMVILLLIIYPRMITVYFAAISLTAFYILERLGLTFDAALRKMRAWLAGNQRPAHSATARRRLVDYGASN